MALESQVLNRIPGIAHGFGDCREPVPAALAALWEKTRPQWKQVHGTDVSDVVSAGQACGEVDALYSFKKDQPVAVVTADCIPVLLAKKDGGAVAAIHAGWRGVRARILNSVWAKLAARGEKSAEWVSVVGPAIGPCCYQVSPEMAADFMNTFSASVTAGAEYHSSSYHSLSTTATPGPSARAGLRPKQILPAPRMLDLPAIQESELRAMGFAEVEVLRHCTKCSLTASGEPRFFSYRREGGSLRQWSAISRTSGTANIATRVSPVVFFALTGLVLGSLASGGIPTAQAEPALRPADRVYLAIRTIAAKRSTEIQIAQNTIEQKDAARWTSIARWLPRVELQLAQSRSRDFSIVTSGALGSVFGPGFTPADTNLSRWSLGISMPLYRRSVHLGFESAGADQDLANSQYRQRIAELDWRLRQLLGNYLLQVYREAAAQSSVDSARRQLQEVKARLRLGQRTQLDLLRQQANVATLESRKLTYQQQKAFDLAALLEYSHLTPEELALALKIQDERRVGQFIEDFTDTGDAIRLLQPWLRAKDPASLDGRIANFSPAYRNYVAQEELTLRQARTSAASEFPELLLQGNLNKQADNWGDTFNSSNVSRSIGLVLNIPIFTGGAIISSTREQNRAQAITRLQSEQSILKLKNDIWNQRIRIESLEKSIDSQKLAVNQNAEIVRLSERTYGLGKTTLVDLLRSQDDLLQSKIDLANSRNELSVVVHQFAANLGVEVP